MEEKYLKLLMMALKLGWININISRETLEYCENARNDYFLMIQVLENILNLDLDGAMDCY